MEDDLFRVESAVSATSSGNLTWDVWTHDCVTALALAGRRNPLGFAVVRYLSDPGAAAAWGVVLHLSTELIKRGNDKHAANQAAWRAFEFWHDARCPRCQGRGTLIPKRVCPDCNGTGQRRQPDESELIKDAVSCLVEAEQWMEGQLHARLKRGGLTGVVA